MEETLVTIEIARLLKKLGFNVPTIMKYNDNDSLKESAKIDRSNKALNFNAFIELKVISMPTLSLVQKWVREMFNTDVIVMQSFMLPSYNGEDVFYTFTIGKFINGSTSWEYDINIKYESYEEALIGGLLDVLKKILYNTINDLGMIEVPSLILFRKNLRKCCKNKPTKDLTLNDFTYSGEGKSFRIAEEKCVILFIDDDSSTIILKNRYGRVTRRYE